MACRILYSPAALSDLEEIYEYIQNELSNSKAAAKTVEGIFRSINILKDFPESGAMIKDIINIRSEYRFVRSGNYMAFYRYRDGCVYIDRILYGRRDYLKTLFAEPEQK